ncbi:unnamed protein product, partial [Amoebophrya sp. A25]
EGLGRWSKNVVALQGLSVLRNYEVGPGGGKSAVSSTSTKGRTPSSSSSSTRNSSSSTTNTSTSTSPTTPMTKEEEASAASLFLVETIIRHALTTQYTTGGYAGTSPYDISTFADMILRLMRSSADANDGADEITEAGVLTILHRVFVDVLLEQHRC